MLSLRMTNDRGFPQPHENIIYVYIDQAINAVDFVSIRHL